MANSFKQMTKAGVIKRTDTGMFIALSDIHVREGFNKREDDERTRLADDDLFNYLMCRAAKFFAPKRIKLCTAANERKTAIAHGAN